MLRSKPKGGPMTEPILAAEVLAEAWVVREAVASSLDALVPEAMAALLALYEKEVAALLALFPEGDVVIRRDGTLAGLEVAPGLCWGCNGSKYERLLGEDNAEVVIACSVCNGAGLLYRLVPLSREAE